jgi:hypothetical protein
LVGLVAGAFVVRVANAVYYYGFFSGDDVEIHQMTFSALFGTHGQIWELRSPFYPMTFIYPVQWLAVHLGISDPMALILSARLVVAVFSCCGIWMIFRIATDHLGGLAVGLVAALFLASSRLHIHFGSSELPGPVASVFLLAAFWAVLSPGRSALLAVTAGTALSLAACLRFSEGVYALAFAAHLLIERRWRDLTLGVLAGAATAVIILGLGDALYWGEPFHSLQNIVDFTLVRKASSRGYEPVYYYVAHAAIWSDVFTLGFFLVALLRRQWRAGLWVLVAIALLSLLPHKEERYVVPALPFVAMAAAQGFVYLLDRVRRPDRAAGAFLLLLALGGAVLFELEGARFRRSEAAVDLARYLSRQPDAHHVAIEQSWRAGSDLFLGRATLWDLDPNRMDDHAYLGAVLERPEFRYIALRDESIRRAGLERMLESAGFVVVPIGLETSREYRLFRRREGG